MNHAGLGDRPGDGDHPPREVGLGERRLPFHGCEEERCRERREDEAVYEYGDGRRHTSLGRERVVW
jgi:hypothetical protein